MTLSTRVQQAFQTALGLSVLAGTLAVAQAQNHVGAAYGSRDPHPCASQKEPRKGAPSNAQAKQYFTCYIEGIDHFHNLKLATDITVEVGSGRPFIARTDSTSDIDTSQTVYPIRGGFTLYTCQERARVTGNPNKNCSRETYTKNTGICYKTTFGDWVCELDYSPDFRNRDSNVAPPAN